MLHLKKNGWVFLSFWNLPIGKQGMPIWHGDTDSWGPEAPNVPFPKGPGSAVDLGCERWLFPKDRKVLDPPSWKGEFERTCISSRGVYCRSSKKNASDLEGPIWLLGYYMGTTVICFSLGPKFGIKTWNGLSCLSKNDLHRQHLK